ncbi:DUF2939 domain-containing protein [Variovorax dokdonensis]|uniref:DUF2939 domain-containing protein n=1 Tax=Variovorax dokdonensis TaxID=344883 RepID=A0ABT7NFX4_9BURK|nr:DUF2939 domain-containing protein [Variovorax dokdonensis]MDM0046827.1 DUF2939 domain-containing protein [Variovorax dokdonensis]
MKNFRRDARLSTVRDPFSETRRDAISGHVSSRQPGESDLKGFAALAVVIMLALAAAALYFGPYWTVYRMRAAIEHGDAQAVSSYVDFPAFRESLKAQILLVHNQAVGSSAAQSNPFAALGKDVDSAADSMVDALLTPTGVMAMIQEGRVKAPAPPFIPPPPLAASSMDTSSQPSKAQTQPVTPPWKQSPRYKVEYADFSTARLRPVDGSPGAFVLRRRKLVQWQLAEIEIPLP